ncbi:unnamed protein product [Arabidopsis arenosa]|uniref:KIB1-4 beta-propeller domain-containing protein n=1 Tax=Arabidopsis arenosa TaxID=38785 RepID=A0A8S2A235_ARAAE|nr:unnamed protein product [Arabidopsis arenosa]
MESQILGGQVRFKPERDYFHGYLVGPSRRDKVPYDYEAVEWEKSLAVLWVNETTGDYVVAWTFMQRYLFSYKKGDGFWRDLNSNGKSLVLFDMACENSMLYLLTNDHRIKIFYISGDFFTGEQNRYLGSPFNFVAQPWEYIWKRKLAIRRSGEVLIVLSLKHKVKKEEKLLFYIFKMNLESCKWERVYSIGDEMLSFGRGVTVPLALKDLGDGIKSDSIYFVDEDVWPDHKDHDHRVSNCGVFDIATTMDTTRNGDWSKLCPDLLRKIFKILKSPVDSHRAKTVCSNWYSVWKTCSNKPRCPSWIIHQGDSTTKQSKRKVAGISKTSYCIASSGNWVLMVDRRLKFYIHNLLTKERINLTSMELKIRGDKVSFKGGSKSSEYGYMVGPSGKDYVSYDEPDYYWKNSLAVLWINETTRDYVVAWTFKQKYLFSHKKGTGFWCNMNLNGKGLDVLDMACEKSKLYLFTSDYHIKSFYFYGTKYIEFESGNMQQIIS